MGDFGQAITYPAALATYMNRYLPDCILMRHVNLSWENHPWLQQQGWMYVYFDDRYFLMVSSRVEYRALIQQESYQYILPWENRPVTAANARQVLAEAERALMACPEGATFAWAYKSEALRLIGRHEESFSAKLKCLHSLSLSEARSTQDKRCTGGEGSAVPMVHPVRERPNARGGRERRRRHGRLWQGYTDYAGGLGVLGDILSPSMGFRCIRSTATRGAVRLGLGLDRGRRMG